MFPEQITGIPASRDKGMPFSHPSGASTGAPDRSCSNVQKVIKENAWNDLKVAQTTTQRWFSQLFSDYALLHIHSHQQNLGGIITLITPNQDGFSYPSQKRLE